MQRKSEKLLSRESDSFESTPAIFHRGTLCGVLLKTNRRIIISFEKQTTRAFQVEENPCVSKRAAFPRTREQTARLFEPAPDDRPRFAFCS